MNKPVEYYIALAGAVLFVVMQHKEKPIAARGTIAGISGAFGYSLAGAVSAYFGVPEILVMTALTAFGYVIMDTVGAILLDRDFFIEVVKARLGGGRK